MNQSLRRSVSLKGRKGLLHEIIGQNDAWSVMMMLFHRHRFALSNQFDPMFISSSLTTINLQSLSYHLALSLSLSIFYFTSTSPATSIFSSILSSSHSLSCFNYVGWASPYHASESRSHHGISSEWLQLTHGFVILDEICKDGSNIGPWRLTEWFFYVGQNELCGSRTEIAIQHHAEIDFRPMWEANGRFMQSRFRQPISAPRMMLIMCKSQSGVKTELTL